MMKAGAALIRQNPDYGIIICRCEEVSKGEILDALRSPIPVPTVDGIKKRVRPAWPLPGRVLLAAGHSDHRRIPGLPIGGGQKIL